MARTMRNMHVPAYCPVDVGIHDIEYSGVDELKKKVMAMLSIPIIEALSIDSPAEVPIAMPDIVAVGDVDMVILESILSAW